MRHLQLLPDFGYLVVPVTSVLEVIDIQALIGSHDVMPGAHHGALHLRLLRGIRDTEFVTLRLLCVCNNEQQILVAGAANIGVDNSTVDDGRTQGEGDTKI